MKNKKELSYLLLFSIVIIFASVFLNSNTAINYFESRELKTFSEELSKEQQKLVSNVNSLNNLLSNKSNYKEYLSFGNKIKALNKKNTSIYIFKKKLPIYWTNNVVALNNFVIEKINTPYISKLNNGWYIIFASKNKQNGFTTVGFTLIKNEYLHQNKYLQNDISSNFSLRGNYNFYLEEQPETKALSDTSGRILFYLSKSENLTPTSLENILSSTCLFGIFLLLIFIYKYTFSQYKKLRKDYFLWLYYSLLFATWLILYLAEFPSRHFNSLLFSPSLYAESALLQSLGHLILNTLFILFGVYMFYSVSLHNKSKKQFLLFKIIFYLLPLLGILISGSIHGLIENSSIMWGLNDIFGLNLFSYLSFLIIGVLFLIYFLVAEKATLFFLQSNKNILSKVSLLLFPYIIAYIVGIKWYHISNPLYTLWNIPLLIYFLYYKNITQVYYSFFSILFYILLFALSGAYFIENTLIEKEYKEEKILALRIGEDKDPVAEYLFLESVEKIASDPVLIDSIEWYLSSKDWLNDYLQKKYFTGYWNKFDVRFTYCRAYDSLTISPLNITENCVEYIEKKQYKEDFSKNNQLLYVKTPEGGVSYIAKIKIYDSFSTDKGALNLYIEFFSKIFSKTEGYPELLLDEKEIKQTIVPGEYSFAKYKSGTLISAAGEYKYPLTTSVLPFDSSKTHFTEKDFFHHVYKSENTLVILSKKEKTFINHITAFSYLFAFYGFAVFFCLLIFFKKSFSINFSSFSNKLQLFLVSFILFSITLIGVGTSYYISIQYKQKNYKAISEKLRSVTVELEGKIAQYETLNPELRDYITFYLIKFSNVFYSDINLYNTNGELIATSRQEIFNIGLQGTQMNPSAYSQLSILKNTEYVHEERIGKLNYLSGYIPLYNNKEQLLAYLNLPYFAKQNELEKELSTFLVAIINVYVLLFVLSIIIAFLFSAYLTKPLRLLREKIAGVELGKTNELLEWEGDDEIGSLVKEYNRMVIELENSAEKLAKSERESAWREMAKQVAHEIKNPLTPMKLSIQHLKRAFDDNAPDLNKRVEKTTQTLVEQIETLSHIAGEFSSFAKMPTSNNINILPENILKNVVLLYEESENIEINYTPDELSKNAQIIADYDQINRVFNNLIKNAIQSIPENKKGIINISTTVKNKWLCIKISDNGSGIPNELIDKIFTPNFTTKTTGAGLGLAMVKNIVENSKGKIWFETTINKGTAFFVSWPVVD